MPITNYEKIEERAGLWLVKVLEDCQHHKGNYKKGDLAYIRPEENTLDQNTGTNE